MSKSTIAVKAPLRPSKSPGPLPFGRRRWVPEPYMKRAVKFLLEHAAAALFLDPGMCKTSITLCAIKILLHKGVNRGALVVAPLRPAVSTWPGEVAKWAEFEGLSLVVLHHDNPARLARMVDEDHDIYVINYEGLRKLFTRVKKGKVWKPVLTELGKKLLDKVDILVWDELSKMKNSDTQRYTLVKPWIGKFARRIGLTGTPAANGLMGLFGQCYVLDEGNALGPYVTHYKAEYFVPIGAYDWELKDGAEKKIIKRLKPLSLRLEAEDYMSLPQLLPHPIKFTLPPAVREHYDQMENHLLTYIEKERITAANVAGSINKCRQLCSGAVFTAEYDEITGERKRKGGKREWVWLHDEKLNAFADLVEELQGQQLLVGYDYQHDLARLQERFPDVPYIGSGVSVKKGKEIEAQWNAGELRMLFAHPSSVAFGLNFQEASAAHVAFFTPIWDFEVADQYIRRLRRRGSLAKWVHVYQFVAENSVEESVVWAQNQKDAVQRNLLGALKARRRLD